MISDGACRPLRFITFHTHRSGNESTDVEKALWELDGWQPLPLAATGWIRRPVLQCRAEEETVNRIVVKARASNDGSVRVELPAGSADPNTDLQVTVETMAPSAKRMLLACDLVQSGLVGIWAGRDDIGDSRAFARRLREEAQRRDRAS
jgi:hypothetical protein